MKKMISKLPLLASLLVISTGLMAAENLKMFGTLLVPPPCVIENDNVIQVFFGNNVGLHKVDGNNFKQEIDYKLVCEPNTKNWDLMLSLRGPKSSFDEKALQTNISNLGIRVLQNGVPFEINKPMKIAYSNKPTLEAVPVKELGTTLPEGAFSVTATLLAEYQ